MWNAKDIITPPIASKTAPINQQIRDPQRSRIVPTGKADTLAVMDAIVKNRFNLSKVRFWYCFFHWTRAGSPESRNTPVCDIPQILLRAQFQPLRYFSGGTSLTVDAFFDENRLQRREAKDDPRRAPTREHSDDDLNWKVVRRWDLPLGG